MEQRNGQVAEAAFYQGWLEELQQAAQLVVEQIALIGKQIEEQQGRKPVEHCKWRIKTAVSMQEKLQRNQLPPTLEMAKLHIQDGAGVRVVCPFVNDVYRLVESLCQQSDWTVLTKKDYMLHPKDNGYRSYHLIVQVTIQCQGKAVSVPVEIQLRTIAMDCWASLEHQLRYKKHLPESAALAMELKRCADEMASTDLSMQAIQEILDTYHGGDGKTVGQKEGNLDATSNCG